MRLAALIIIVAALALPAGKRAAGADLFVGIPGEVLRLHDATGDGDFLDALEVLPYATGIGPGNTGLAFIGNSLFVATLDPPRILRLDDLNEDGDALDFGEVMLHALLPGGAIARQPRGMSRDGSSRLLVCDQANHEVLAMEDLNNDGDALDAGELSIVATGLVAPQDITLRPDGALLVAQSSSTQPILILLDRNGDGDFLDFAEQLSYVENLTSGNAIHAASNDLAFFAQPSLSQLMRLEDWTGDADALDVGEALLHATGVSGVHLVTTDAVGGLFVAGQPAPGNIHRVTDKNGDGDALDFDEVELVATSITGAVDLAVPLADVPCMPGDANGDGQININDVIDFADALVGAAPAELCRHDVSGDGLIDGRDVAHFVELLLP